MSHGFEIIGFKWIKKVGGIEISFNFRFLNFQSTWWIRTDLNRRPGDYESPALTD